MAKSTDAFRTIGEVSDDLDVPKHVLRFWEGKFPQLKPMKRGGGRRFYRPEDVALLRGIHQLLHASGYTIKGVQRILRDDGIEAVKSAATNGSVEPVAPVPAAAAVPAKKRQAAAPPAKSAQQGKPAPHGLSAQLRAQLNELAAELDACLELARKGMTAATSPGPTPTRAVAGKTKR